MINPRYIDRTIYLTILLCLLATGALWWQTNNAENSLRSEAIVQAELRAKQLNIALAEQVGFLIRYVDYAAQELAEAYANGRQKEFLAQAHKVEKRFPEHSLLQLAVIGSDGYIAASTLEIKDRVYLGDREHFRAHLEAGEPRLYISAPVFGRISKQWTIQFTRPVTIKGRFGGVVVVSISPEYLRNTLSTIPMSENDSIAIFRQSGEYLARNVRNAEVMGKNVGPNRAFVGENAAPSGAFRAPANFDKVVRLFSWQRLPEIPLVVVLGISENTLLKQLEGDIVRQRWQAGVATAVLWLLAIGLLVMLDRLRR